MSDTPRVDKVLSDCLWSGGRSRPSIYEVARQLERELNEARKDTERLDWISTGDGLYHLTRAEIDKAMQRELLIEKIESDDRDERKDQYERENNDYE